MVDGITDPAILGLIGSAIGSLGGIFLNTKLMNYRIEQLEKKVEKHNNLIERTYQLEEGQLVMAEKIRVANHRIKDLEDIQKGERQNDET